MAVRLRAGFVWTAVAVAIAPLSKGKRVPASGAATQVILLAFFTASVVLYALENGVQGFALGDFSPTWGAFLVVAPVLFYNLVGFELPSAAGGEMRNPQRDVPASIARAGAITVVLYSVPRSRSSSCCRPTGSRASPASSTR